MSKTKVLVTGANGYIGRHVVEQLLDMGADVLAADFNFDGVVDVYDMDYIVYNFEQYNEQVLDRKDPELSYDGRTLEDILEAVGYHEEVRLEEMTIDKTSIFLNVGETDKITATITPENVTGVSLIWKSSNEKVVTVDSEGNVTAVANRRKNWIW